jgi:outer membrane protein
MKPNNPGQLVAYPLWEQLSDGLNSYIGVGVNVPIFNGWQVQTGIKNAKLNLQNQEYNLQLTENALYKEIQQAFADAVAAQKRYQSAAKAVEAMQEAFRYTEQRYELGLMNFVDYSTIKMRLTTNESDMMQAKFEYIFKTIVLNFYSGQPIRL